MIIKFDHISYVCARKDKNKILIDKGNPLFKEAELNNLEIKKELMNNPQKNHDLFFFDEGYPTEYIFYDFVNKQSKIKLIDNILYGKYSNKQGAVEFLRGIFGNRVMEENNDIICNMRGVIDKRDYILVLERTFEETNAWLDDAGFGIVTLVNNTRFSKKPIDGICTEYEVLNVNGKELEICFTKSCSTNIIFEMIKIH